MRLHKLAGICYKQIGLYEAFNVRTHIPENDYSFFKVNATKSGILLQSNTQSNTPATLDLQNKPQEQSSIETITLIGRIVPIEKNISKLTMIELPEPNRKTHITIKENPEIVYELIGIKGHASTYYSGTWKDSGLPYHLQDFMNTKDECLNIIAKIDLGMITLGAQKGKADFYLWQFKKTEDNNKYSKSF